MKSRTNQEIFSKETEDDAHSSSQISTLEVDVQAEKFRLKKHFGIAYGIAMTVGLMIGSGIFISPQIVLEYAGSPGLTLIIWTVGGLFALFGCLTAAEIGLRIPVSGTTYAYLYELYNPYIAVLCLYQYTLLARPGSNAIKLIIFGRYILKPFYGDCEIPQMAILTVSSVLSLFITLLNCMKIKTAARGQSLLAFLSVSTLFLIIGLGIYYWATGGSLENLHKPFKDSCTEPGCFGMAFYGAAFSFHGWKALNHITEEIHNPKKTLPTAVVLSTLFVTVVYVLTNLTYLTLLDKSEALSSQAIAISSSMKISTVVGWITSILIGITASSGYNTAQLVGSRVAFVGARNGHLPKCLSFINIKFVSPIVAVIFVNFIALMYSWLFDVKYLLSSAIFSIFVFEFLVMAGYIRRRIKMRHIVQEEQFEVPLAIHFTYALFLLFLILILLVTNFVASAAFFFVLTAIYTIYYHIFVKERLPFRVIKWTKNVSDKINDFIQKLLYCAPEEKFN